MVAAWLLRTCTLTVTAAGDRRRLRGAPVVRRPPGAVVGPLAPGGGGARGDAADASGRSGSGSLGCCSGTPREFGGGHAFVAGLCLAVCLWVGPGAGHVRWPVRVVAQAVARRTGRWAVVVVVLVATAGFVGHQATLSVGWSPFGAPIGLGAGS